jgi:predicted O-linked N-acetylglucosamine transferase (SPINDLY family)
VYSADVILDPFPFGGLISTYEILCCGRPLITFSGNKLYGRFTSGLYRKMNIDMAETHLIADSMNDYVNKAIKLANNNEILDKIEINIIEKYPLIIHDKNTIDDWCVFLKTI